MLVQVELSQNRRRRGSVSYNPQSDQVIADRTILPIAVSTLTPIDTGQSNETNPLTLQPLRPHPFSPLSEFVHHLPNVTVSDGTPNFTVSQVTRHMSVPNTPTAVSLPQDHVKHNADIDSGDVTRLARHAWIQAPGDVTRTNNINDETLVVRHKNLGGNTTPVTILIGFSQVRLLLINEWLE